MSRVNDLHKRLTGRDLPPAEIQRIAAARETLGVREDDALMSFLVLLGHHQAMWEKVPNEIRAAASASAEDARMQAEVIMAEAVKSASPQLAERISREISKRMEGVTDALRYKWISISLIAMIVLIGAAGAAGWWTARTGQEAVQQAAFEQGIAWCRENPAKCLGRKP